jgi:NADPH-dependent glutamate synthase beta subunit-like oxidoreductase
MAGSRKEELAVQTTSEEVSDEREVYLRDGRKLVVSEQGGESLVEVRSESGMLEVRIRLTEQGPVLQMESARLSLKASEAVEIESERVEIKGGAVKVHADEDLDLEADRDVRVAGKMIYLN